MGLVIVHGEVDIGVPHRFLWLVMGKREKRQLDGTWRLEGAYRVLKAGGTKDIRTYIDRRQEIMTQWVFLWPIFEVCAQEARKEGRDGPHGGGRLRRINN